MLMYICTLRYFLGNVRSTYTQIWLFYFSPKKYLAVVKVSPSTINRSSGLGRSNNWGIRLLPRVRFCDGSLASALDLFINYRTQLLCKSLHHWQ